MGILDAIISPIKDVINSLEKPIKTTESIFGEVIDFTEDLIKEIRDMITELTMLFNASKVETLFLSPFKSAALEAIGSVEDLFKILADVSEVSTDGLKDELMTSINATYDHMRKSMFLFKDEMKSMIQQISDDEDTLKRGLYHEFRRIESAIEVIPMEISFLSKKVANEFKVEVNKAFGVIPEFGELAEKETKEVFMKVRRTGTTTRQTFENLEQSIHRRLENEMAQVDLFVILIILLIVFLIASIFFITKSMIVVKIIIYFILLTFVVYLIYETISRFM